ncbi:hypothetical protein BY458DRAFT_500149 [Sporodiniella umbellata]|nr:hypothetical protein BY458DRAFT_500149 [Sporodiniella umbellata]
MSWKKNAPNPTIVIAQESEPVPLLAPPPLSYNHPLLSTPSFSSSLSTLNSLQSAQSCPSLEFSHTDLLQKQSVQIEELQQDLIVLNKKLIQQIDATKKTKAQKDDMQSEIKELSQNLFEQANAMVTSEKEAYHSTEKDLIKAQKELAQAHEELKKERDQLQELKTRLTEEKTNLEETETLDKEGFDLFKDMVASSVPIDCIHKISFLKQSLVADVTPCLRSGFSRLAVKKILDSIIHSPCFIESTTPLKQQGIKRLSFVSRFRSAPVSQCYGCGSKLDMQTDVFRFKLKEQDMEWQCIDRACRNRLVAACNFYAFVRHLRSGLQTTKTIDVLYRDCFQLKLDMFYARSGIDLKR